MTRTRNPWVVANNADAQARVFDVLNADERDPCRNVLFPIMAKRQGVPTRLIQRSGGNAQLTS